MGGLPLKVLMTTLPARKNTRPLGLQSKMALDAHLCPLVVSERASSARGNWLWWLLGARRLCSYIIVASYAHGILGREMARRLMIFCHSLISCPRVYGRKLEVRMCIHLCVHDYSCNISYGMHTLARVTQLAWNSESSPLGPDWNSSVAIMHFKQMWGRSVASKVSCTSCIYYLE